jgi:pyridoxal phosphate enzyme (YggS family)
VDTTSEVNEIIRHNIVDVSARISHAEERAGRTSGGVRLVAISKGQPIEKIRAAYQHGIRDFGENRVREALPKLAHLEDYGDIQWHMVGHIQSRKARSVVSGFHIVHSVDRWKLAHRLDRFAREDGIKLPVLLECNVSGEVAKSGWNLQDEASWSSALPEFERIQDLENIDVQGLMTMAPWISDESILRSCFAKLRELRSFISSKLPGSWNELSMGMTDDFEYAIEEGATIVRIGRAIFGERG